ncbi:sensor histidine kinase [Anaerotruncus sp.]|uniref:sensor histidine kinase n=1 Tax=Anaerotruncus TaxID=244127 RepID=UPI00217157BC|nr:MULTISPECIES: histidine kinase [Anaerotruncus]MCI8492594.1 histidine kinase [Anaerotruncus sp.]
MKKTYGWRLGITGKLFVIICAAACAVLPALNAILPQVFILTLQDDAIKSGQLRNRQIMSQLDLSLGVVDGIGRSIRLDREMENCIRTAAGNEAATRFEVRGRLNGYVINSAGKLISVILHLDNGEFYASSELSAQEHALFEQEWYQNFQAQRREKRYSSALKGYSGTFSINYQDANGRGIGSETALAIAMPYLGPQGSHGSVLLICSLAPLMQTSTYPLEIEGTRFQLYDNQNAPFYPVDSIFDPADAQTFLETASEQSVLRSDARKTPEGYLLSERSRYGDLKLVTEMTWEMLLAPYHNVIQFISCFTLSAVLLVFCLIFPCIIRALKPLRQLSASMGSVAEGDFSNELQVRSNDEVGDLTISFNEMLRQLGEYFVRIQKKEEEKERLRLGLIIAQISPHFIYNTMNTITYLARKGQTEDVIRVNGMLIGVLRDRLRISDINVCCPVSEEKHIIDQYAVIQTYRYGNIFQIIWEIEEGMMDHLIPKYLIQPLVENALFHGLLPNKEENGNVLGGTIRVQIGGKGGQMRIVVSNDGRMIEPEQLALLNQIINSTEPAVDGRGIGIRNVAARLRLLYKESSRMRLTSGDGVTAVELSYQETC